MGAFDVALRVHLCGGQMDRGCLGFAFGRFWLIFLVKNGGVCYAHAGEVDLKRARACFVA